MSNILPEDESRAILRKKTTQELLSKQVFWQFQIEAIKDEKGPKAALRREELNLELQWITEELQTRPELADMLKQQFGVAEGESNLTMAGLTQFSWGKEMPEHLAEGTPDKNQDDVPRRPDGTPKPPPTVIGMKTLELKGSIQGR